MTSKEFRGSYQWKTARRLALRGASLCAICGRPLRFDVGRRHRLYPTVDHVIPLARLDLSTPAGRAIAVDQSRLRVVHMGCNASRGNRVAPAAPVRAAVAPPAGEQWTTQDGYEVPVPWRPLVSEHWFRDDERDPRCGCEPCRVHYGRPPVDGQEDTTR